MKSVQYFSKEYLDRCSSMKTEQIIQFLEDFRALCLKEKSQRSRLISIKVPEDLLRAFKAKASLNGIPYQTKIKRLMGDWLK